MSTHAQGLIDIGRLALAFAKVNRVTLHEDGVRPESDTDHTVMLSLASCALAEALYKERLNIGLVAQFAVVHDLVEVYVGDTNTINITEDGRKEKEEKEKRSLAMITHQFESVYPWIPTMIEAYERLDTPEARFVKVLDKSMTKVTNILNKGATLRKLGTSKEEITAHFASQTKTYEEKYGEEFPELIVLLKELMNTMLVELYEKG